MQMLIQQRGAIDALAYHELRARTSITATTHPYSSHKTIREKVINIAHHNDNIDTHDADSVIVNRQCRDITIHDATTTVAVKHRCVNVTIDDSPTYLTIGQHCNNITIFNDIHCARVHNNADKITIDGDVDTLIVPDNATIEVTGDVTALKTTTNPDVTIHGTTYNRTTISDYS